MIMVISVGVFALLSERSLLCLDFVVRDVDMAVQSGKWLKKMKRIVAVDLDVFCFFRFCFPRSV